MMMIIRNFLIKFIQIKMEKKEPQKKIKNYFKNLLMILKNISMMKEANLSNLNIL